MSAHILYKPQVAEDVQDIVRYLDQYSAAAGDRFLRVLSEALSDLAQMPGMGSRKNLRHSRLRDVRSWSAREYRQFLILYRPIDNGIEILAIAHGARKLRDLLIKRSR